MLLTAVVFSVYIPFVQNFIISKIENQASKYLNAKVNVKKFDLSYFADVNLENIEVIKQNDTLLMLDKLSLDISFISLLNHKIKIEHLTLSGMNTQLEKLMQLSVSQDESEVNTDNSWTFQLDIFTLKDSYLTRYVPKTKMHLSVDVGEISLAGLQIDSFYYSCDNLSFKNTKISYVAPYFYEDKNDTANIEFVLKSRNTELKNSEVYYTDSLMNVYIQGDIMSAKDMYVNLISEDVVFKNLEISNSLFNIEYINDTIDTGPNLWKANLENIIVQNSKFTYDILYLPMDTTYYDMNHLSADKLNFIAQNLHYKETQISAKFISGSLIEKNTLHINEFSAELFADNSKLKFNNFKLKTANSNLKLDGYLGYNVQDFDFTDTGKYKLKVNYTANKWDDIEYFFPEDMHSVKHIDKIRDKSLSMNILLNGYLDSMNTDFNISYNKDTRIKANGNIHNLVNNKAEIYDLQIDTFKIQNHIIALFTNDKEVLEFVPLNSFYKGKLWNSGDKTKINGKLISDYGHQNINIEYNNLNNLPIAKAKINGDFKSKKLNNTNIKYFVFEGEIQGDKLSNISVQAKFDVKEVNYDSLYYENISTELSLENQIYNLQIVSKDTGTNFSLFSKGSINDSLLDSETKLIVNNLNLNEHSIYDLQQSFNWSSQFDFKYNFNNNATVLNSNIWDINIVDSIGNSSVKKLDFSFIYNTEETSFKLQSDNNSIDAKVYGSLDTLLNNLVRFKNILVLKEKKDSIEKLYFPNVKFHANLTKPYELLGNNIYKSLPIYSDLIIDGEFNNVKNNIAINVFIPSLEYENTVLDSIIMDISGDKNGIDYTFKSGILIDSNFNAVLKIDGELLHRNLTTNLNLSNREQLDFIDIKFQAKETDEGYNAKLIGDTLIILSNKWRINQQNSLNISNSEVVANNMQLHRANKEISIESNAKTKELALSLKNIDLSVFNKLLSNDSVLDGNANIKLTSSYQQNVNRMQLIAKIDTFKYQNHNIGNIDIENIFLDDSIFTIAASVSNASDYSRIDGMVNTNDEIFIDANIKYLDLDFLNIYFDDYLYNVSGNISSQLKINGNIEKPDISGFLKFNNTKFGLIDLREEFSFSNDKIQFNNGKINPKDLKIIDRNNGISYFDGDLSINKGGLLFNNFHIKSDGIELMNSTKEDNNLVYGLMVAAYDIKLNGTTDNLNANTKVELNYPSNVNYIMPEDLSISKNDDIVNFTKIDTLNFLTSLIPDSVKSRKANMLNIFKFLDAELIVKEGCRFNLYFDNSMENYLNLTVEGDMKYLFSNEIPKTSGLLNIVKGKMNYSMPMVSMKELDISNDSYIQITNDINNPYISINATSKIWAQTGELIENYNRNLEITVFVKMRGTMDNLVVQFDVSPKTNDALISSKISQMSEKERTMNAVNLLIRGQFATKQNNVTIDINSYVNSMIAKGLNKVISDRVKFVDISFDIKTFNNINSTGAKESQSNMFFNVSKSFYNDRIRIKYMSNITSTATQLAGEYGSTDSYTQSNFIIEYDINKNGNLQAVLFRKDTYEDILEGDVTSTGGGLKIRRSYNSFGDILKRKKNR